MGAREDWLEAKRAADATWAAYESAVDATKVPEGQPTPYDKLRAAENALAAAFESGANVAAAEAAWKAERDSFDAQDAKIKALSQQSNDAQLALLDANEALRGEL